MGKTPGNDGIPIELYKIFWPLIGKFLIASFNEALHNKAMSPSQKQALITLIEKKGKDRNYLENWRPISWDSIDWTFMLKCLDAFGFWPTLIRWVETFCNGITSCVLNHSISTP